MHLHLSFGIGLYPLMLKQVKIEATHSISKAHPLVIKERYTEIALILRFQKMQATFAQLFYTHT